MPLPLIKLGYLLVRTVAKPVAGTFKRQAKDHPWFRTACGRLAQLYHRVEIRMKRRIAAKAGETVDLTHIKPLDEAKAVELGAEFIGEALIFGVAGAVLLLDASRNSRAESARRILIEQRFEELYHKIGVLEKKLELEGSPSEIKIDK